MAEIPMKDKFYEILALAEGADYSSETRRIKVLNVHAQSCSDLCDQFAVDAMKWADEEGYRLYNGTWHKNFGPALTDKQLLQLFKNRDKILNEL